MKNKPIIIANWKATKTIKETIEWVKKSKPSLEEINFAEIVICPPFTSLPFVASLFQNTSIKVGTQDISKFKKGAFTGEVTVEMIDGLASFCIVGHSERRKYFGETDDDVIKKVELLLQYKITPVLCISDLSQMDSYIERGRFIISESGKIIFVYEPPGAISSGGVYHPEDPETASANAGKIREKIGKAATIIYGGSVNPGNASKFLSETNIAGALIGQASTDPQTFLELLSSIRINSVVD